MRRLVLPLVILAASSSLGAPAPLPKPRQVKSDLALLQGKWVITSSVIRGRRYEFAEGGIVSIRSDTIQQTFRGCYVYEYRLHLPDGERGALDMFSGRSCSRYRYHLAGDVLILRELGQDEPRPTSLQATRRDGYYVHEEWRRVR